MLARVPRKLLLAAVLIVVACAGNKKTVEIGDYRLPVVGDRFHAYKKLPGGKVLATALTGSGYHYIYGVCSVRLATKVAIANCEKTTNSACRVSALGNLSVSGLSQDALGQVMDDYEKSLGTEQSWFLDPVPIVELGLVAAAADTKGDISIGNVRTDRNSPCLGSFSVAIGSLGTCQGTWTVERHLSSDLEFISVVEVAANCDVGTTLSGQIAMTTDFVGAGSFVTAEGRKYNVVLTPELSGVGSVEMLGEPMTVWDEIMRLNDFEIPKDS